MFFAMMAGVLMGWTLLIVMYRINLRRFLGYPALMDFSCTTLLGFLLYGTATGMVMAISGGLFLSLMITVLRKYYGYSRFSVRRRQWVTTQGVINEIVTTKGMLCALTYSLLKFWPALLILACVLASFF